MNTNEFQFAELTANDLSKLYLTDLELLTKIQLWPYQLPDNNIEACKDLYVKITLCGYIIDEYRTKAFNIILDNNCADNDAYLANSRNTKQSINDKLYQNQSTPYPFAELTLEDVQRLNLCDLPLIKLLKLWPFPVFTGHTQKIAYKDFHNKMLICASAIESYRTTTYNIFQQYR